MTIGPLRLWVTKTFAPEALKEYTREEWGIYNSQTDKWLLNLTGRPRREGGPLEWCNDPHSFNDEAIRTFKENRHLRQWDDDMLWLVPITVNTTRVKTSAVTTEIVESSRTPDFTECVPFSAVL